MRDAQPNKIGIYPSDQYSLVRPRVVDIPPPHNKPYVHSWWLVYLKLIPLTKYTTRATSPAAATRESRSNYEVVTFDKVR